MTLKWWYGENSKFGVEKDLKISHNMVETNTLS